jgi:hypothetical protein
MKLRTFQPRPIGVGILFHWMCIVFIAQADETLPLLRVGTAFYTNVTITGVTATDIYFTSARGLGNAKLKNLDPTLQKHFKFDPASAEVANTNQKAGAPQSSNSATTGTPQNIDRTNARTVMDDAIARVKAIVNQPVRALPRTPEMEVSTCHPGWFHDGAIKPDFNTIDIRTTQDTKFDQRPFITSDLNPGVAFVGPEIEFNPMTKYFYVDRSLPKKKLTEAEMVEINGLYRVIGKCEDKLKPPSAQILDFVSGHTKALMVVAGSLVLLLVVVRFWMANRVD